MDSVLSMALELYEKIELLEIINARIIIEKKNDLRQNTIGPFDLDEPET